MKVKFAKTSDGEVALTIDAIIDIINKERDRYWQESAQADQPMNIAAATRKEAYDDLEKRLRELDKKLTK